MTDPTEDDLTELDACAQEKSGTLIRVTELHRDALPRATEITEGLKNRAGVIYYYYLKGIADGSEQLSLTVDDDDITAVDPLFEDEIDSNDSDLNEHTWDGLRTKWITNSQAIQLAVTKSTTAQLDITQLPHPPSVEREGSMSRANCRNYYRIGAGNYGFYIYRNWRLISWADSLVIQCLKIRIYTLFVAGC